jgi:multisubunit Na+/H+ antiporter MnhG subunit
MAGAPPAVPTQSGRPFQVQPLASGRRFAALRAVPLAAIMILQAVLIGSLLRMGIASGQESRYIYAGHQLIHELWHGGGSPYYETYFPGVPLFYPVLAAMADAVGGLAAVRLMSIVFMLMATALLYLTARRMFGYWPAIGGAGLFATLALSRHVGASATPDAMSLALMAAAACCAVLASERSVQARRWLLAVPAALLAANAVSYASVVFDPVVIGLAALLLSDRGWRRVGQRALALSCATITVLSLAAVLAGTSYLSGIRTAAILSGRSSASLLSIEHSSWHWLGLVLCIAAAGLVVATLPGERKQLPRLLLLGTAGLLITAEAMHLHNVQALTTSGDFGAWFACIAAGYAVGRLAELPRSRFAAAALSSLMIAPIAAVAIAGASQAQVLTTAANSAVPEITALQPYLATPGKQHYLIASYQDIAYDLRPSPGWQQVTDSFYVSYPLPGHPGRYLHDAAGLAAAIKAHWFALISVPVTPAAADTFSRLVLRQAQATSAYYLASVTGGVCIYVYLPDYRAATRR